MTVPQAEADRRLKRAEFRLIAVFLRVHEYAKKATRHVPRRLNLRVGCALIRRMRKSNPRAFFHVNHRRNTVCTVPEASWLAMGHIVGLIAHELGHLIAGRAWDRSAQHDADEAVRRFLKLPIRYRGSLLLQWVPPAVVRRVLGRLARSRYGKTSRA